MTTAWQAYQQPIDDFNRWDRHENDEHSWDREIDRLHVQDEHAPRDQPAPAHEGRVLCMELEDIKRWMTARARQRTEQEETNDSHL